MDEFLSTPFTLLDASDEVQPGTFGAAEVIPGMQLPDVTRNYADNADVKRRVMNEIYPVMEQARLIRVPLEEEWRQILRMEMMIHDSGRTYLGRSETYLPLFARIQSSLVSALSRGLFPSDEYLDVSDRASGNPETAKPVKQYLQWEFDRVAHVRARIKAFLRQGVSYGNSPLKFTYYNGPRREVRYQKQKLLSGDVVVPSFGRATNFEGLRVSPRSVFFTYVWPATAENLDEATLIFEDIHTARGFIQEMGVKKYWENTEAALRATPPAGHQHTLAELHTNAFGMSSPTVTSLGDKALGNVVVLQEVWTYLSLPDSAYLEGEEKGEPVPVMIVMANDVILRVQRNPFSHQRPPYLWHSTNKTPGLFYGYGTGRLVRPLQYLTNDFANQTNDCGNYCLNPISKVNPAFLAGPLRPLAPGVQWYLSDIEQGQKFDRPPIELIQAGMSMLNMYFGMGQDMGGAPPIMQGTGSAKGAKTATGAQILQRNAMAPLQDVVEDIELEVMMPLMFGTWLNAQQFRKEDVMVAVAGQSIRIPMSSLAIDPEFRWMASSQAVNQAQRAQQAISLIQAVMPLAPYLAQMGKVVDPTPLIKRVFTDGFGFRGFDDFIKPMQGGPMQPGQPVTAQMQGQAMGETQDRVRSTLDQLGQGIQGMQPGEGEDFMDVRGQADQMAGLMGEMK